MSLDKHSLGDGASHPWGVPALRPLPARRQAHWNLTPSGGLPLFISGDLRSPRARRTPLVYSRIAYSFQHPAVVPCLPSRTWGALTRHSHHLSGVRPTVPVAQVGCQKGAENPFWVVPIPGDRSKDCGGVVRRWR